MKHDAHDHDDAPLSSVPARPLRDDKGKWLPGQTGNAGGLPRTVREARKLAASVAPTALATLVDCLGSQNQRIRIEAAKALLDRAGVAPMAKQPDEGLDEASLAMDVTPVMDRAVRAIPSDVLAAIVKARNPDPDEHELRVSPNSSTHSEVK